MTAALMVLVSSVVVGQEADAPDFRRPSGHFKLENPDLLEKDDANVNYNAIGDMMARTYAESGEQSAIRYRQWQRFNDAPFISADHGNRYVNIFADPAAVAAGYGFMAPGTSMPEGAVIAKDSFTATEDGNLFAGALFIMEKLAAGESRENGDWRYVMILPDGTLFGDSQKAADDGTKFCHSCHVVRADTDALFQVPEAYRIGRPSH